MSCSSKKFYYYYYCYYYYSDHHHNHSLVLLVLTNLVLTRENGRSHFRASLSLACSLFYHYRAWTRCRERQLRLIYANVINLYLFGFMYHISLLRCNILHRNLSISTPSIDVNVHDVSTRKLCCGRESARMTSL